MELELSEEISGAVERAAQRKKNRDKAAAVEALNREDKKLLDHLITERNRITGLLSTEQTAKRKLEVEQQNKKKEAAECLKWADRAAAGILQIEPGIQKYEAELAEIEKLVKTLQ